jgi:hypothetical protein
VWCDPWRALLFLVGGASCLYEGHIYLNEIWMQDKTCILVGAGLVEMFYLSVSTGIPVLASNYKLHIFSLMVFPLSQHTD